MNSELVYSFLMGIGWLFLISWAVALLVAWFEKYLDDGPIEIVISILTPYAAYVAAESVRASV